MVSQAETIRSEDGHTLVEVQPDRAHPIGESARKRFHDEMLVEMEHRSPEGEDTHNVPTWVLYAALIVPFVLIAGGLAALWHTAGAPAAGVGAVMAIGLYAWGGLPQWNAARIRLKERLQHERKIEQRIVRFERRAACKAHEPYVPPRPTGLEQEPITSPARQKGAISLAHWIMFAAATAVILLVFL